MRAILILAAMAVLARPAQAQSAKEKYELQMLCGKQAAERFAKDRDPERDRWLVLLCFRHARAASPLACAPMRAQLLHLLRVAGGVLNSNEVWVASLERLIGPRTPRPDSGEPVCGSFRSPAALASLRGVRASTATL